MTRGFDAIVGNPPFLGGKKISTVFGEAYRDYLAALHEGASSNADLVAHFFRRAFELLRDGGAFGLVATNTIAQGDTRAAGLAFIAQSGGTIFDARKRLPWPGQATVVVSVVHVAKGLQHARETRLDGRVVDRVSAFLFHRGGDVDPARLSENADKSFIGCFLRGMGFTFDDENPAATPLAEMHRLVEKEPKNAERIFPYLGGEELNASPTSAHRRHVIHFGQMRESEARAFPDLVAIVEAKVRPDRARLGSSPIDRAHKEKWWRFANDRPELAFATRGLSRVLATARVSRSPMFTFISTAIVPSEQLVLFAFDSDAAFAVLQSSVHELWVRLFASTLGDGLRYTPSDCFDTFPFPDAWEKRSDLEASGRATRELRDGQMLARGEGLTATSNRLNDPDAQDDDTQRLRAVHHAMDEAVFAAYGFVDLAPTCAFMPEHEEDPVGVETRGRKRRKPWRYRFPDALRDEVLERLLALNARRAHVGR